MVDGFSVGPIDDSVNSSYEEVRQWIERPDPGPCLRGKRSGNPA